MSFRKMLKVSLLMLLAMALAATTAHARIDLFGKLLTSQNQPNPNSAEGVMQLLVKGKGKSNVDDEYSGTIPYTECIKTCDTCFCTRKWPPESNICICGDNSKSKKPAVAVQQVESSRSKVKSDMIPYSECIENCKGICACTLIYPPELSKCICLDSLESTTAKAAEKLQKKMDLVSKPAAISEEGWLPYPECIEKCDECVICTKIYPIELAYCYCGKSTTSNFKKPAIQNSVQQVESSRSKVKSDMIPYSECIENCKGTCACTLIYPPELSKCICLDSLESTTAKAAEKLHKNLDLVSKPAAISEGGWLPYPECIEKCDECVVCTRIYPIEKALCYCGKNTTSNFKKPAIQNSVQEVESSSSKMKSEIMPYSECMENCKGACACTLIYPPELSTCICSDPIESTTAKAVEKLHKKLDLVSKPVAILKEGWLPYPECIEKCDECVVCTRVYPIELAYCYCGKNTTSNSKKLAIQNSEAVEESHKKLDLVSKTVAISAEGFLPYPECIEQCDECVICTRVYPIEKAWCYCGKKTTSNFQKWAIQNLGDDIKVVLWVKASSKAAGRALPI